MGYACPVCSVPQRDGEHLAHHLAFTAMIHGDDHEDWLDEHAPDWESQDPEGLAEQVTPHAEETEYHEVFEDTTGGHDHGEGHGHGRPTGLDAARRQGAGGMSEETQAVIEEARELTREMMADDDESAADDS